MTEHHVPAQDSSAHLSSGLTAPVLLALGNDSSGDLALDWAADEARSRGRELLIVRVHRWAPGAVPWETADDRVISADLRRLAQSRVDQALERVRAGWPDVRVRGEVIEGIADEVLIELSASADVMVIGSRRLSAIGGAILGSVSTAVAARAHGPVVVIGGSPGDPREQPNVVVGVDGSAGTDHALAFAFDHAARHGRALRAVFCWRPDLLAEMQWRPEQSAPEQAERWLAEAVAGWQEKYPDVVVHRAVVRAHPVAGLVAEATAQDLLVVASTSHHPRVGALLGSVTQGVLHHARCPVAVLHPHAVATA